MARADTAEAAPGATGACGATVQTGAKRPSVLSRNGQLGAGATGGDWHQQQDGERRDRGRAGQRHRLEPARRPRPRRAPVPARGAPSFDFERRAGGRVAALREDDVGGHQRSSSGFDVIARAGVDGPEFGDRDRRAVERRQHVRAGRELAQPRDERRRGLGGRRNLGHPERDALARGDVGLLAAAHVGERHGGVARVQVECAARGALFGDVLFGVDDEEGRGDDRYEGCRTD